MKKNNFISSLWNFDCAENSLYLTHGIFRWYGKLVPQLVSKVLDLYTEKDDTIIANFSGSGTIALEAMTREINCIGTDINPLALLISKIKTKYIFIENLDDYITNLINKAISIENSVSVEHLYQPEKWYNNNDSYKLVALKTVIKKVENQDIQDFFMGVLMNIVRDCSNIDSRCVNHIVVDKAKVTKDVYNSFRESAISMYNCIQEIESVKNNNEKIRFLQHSADDMSYAEDNSIDLVFSHPPYLNAVNYYNIYRLCTDLLDLKYEDIRSKDFSAKKLDTFLMFMERSFEESYRVLKPGKRCVVVIGDTRYKGNLVTLQVDFVDLLKSVGFAIEDMFIWELNKKAGMNVARHGNFIDHNFVIVAKKEVSNGEEKIN